MINEQIYVIFQRRFSRKFHIAYIDVKNYMADDIFVRHNLRVKFKEECTHPDDKSPYMIIFCSIAKKDIEKFDMCMGELGTKMLLCGYPDYVKYCTAFAECMETGDIQGWIQNNIQT